MWTQQGDRRGVVGAGFAPAEFGVDNVCPAGNTALRNGSPTFCHAIELVLRARLSDIQSRPLIGEIELPGFPGANRNQPSCERHARDHLGTAAVGADGDELPAMGFVLGQVCRRSRSASGGLSRIIFDPCRSWKLFDSSAMYSVPFLKATPFGRWRPDARGLDRAFCRPCW